jgi:hypothetical protein
MKFNDYLTQKYVEWRGDAIGREKSLKDFAEWIGVSNQLLTYWMRQNGKIPKHKRTIDKLIAKFGPEIYNPLGLARPDTIPLDQLPPEMRDRLITAIYEVNSTLGSLGLSGDSPESEDIVIKIFEKYGFKYTRTTKL